MGVTDPPTAAGTTADAPTTDQAPQTEAATKTSSTPADGDETVCCPTLKAIATRLRNVTMPSADVATAAFALDGATNGGLR